MKLSLALKNLNFLTCKLQPYEISWKLLKEPLVTRHGEIASLLEVVFLQFK